MPALLVWVLFLLLPAALILGLLWFLLRGPIRWAWSFLMSFLPWPTDHLGQRVICEDCGYQIRAGRGPAKYGKCPRHNVTARTLRTA